MTSQEPPLTRREARERERLREAQAAPSTPETSIPDASAVPSAPAAPYPGATPSAFAPPPAPVAPQPVPAGLRPATAAPAPQSAAAPAAPTPQPVTPPQPAATPQPPVAARPAIAPQPVPAQPAQPQAASPQAAAPQPGGRAPERTLTRRELRAMLGVSQLEDEDLDEGIDDPAADAAPQTGRVVSAPPVNAPQSPTISAISAASPEASAAPPRRQPTPPPVVAPAANAGHWTQQLDTVDEPAEPFDQLLSRGGVSRGVPTTTNALILPVLPDDGKIVSPIAGGDEVIVTGSIDLPRSYGATGVHPSQVDSTDIDRLFDNVEDAATTGVAPVAATKAISTQHAATKQMMAPPKKDGPNVPLVLAVTAGVLALGVVATLIIGAVFRLF